MGLQSFVRKPSCGSGDLHGVSPFNSFNQIAANQFITGDSRARTVHGRAGDARGRAGDGAAALGRPSSGLGARRPRDPLPRAHGDIALYMGAQAEVLPLQQQLAARSIISPGRRMMSMLPGRTHCAPPRSGSRGDPGQKSRNRRGPRPIPRGARSPSPRS